MPKADNITLVPHRIQTAERHAHNSHKGGVLWLTGLSGAGKSTLAFNIERRLFDRGYQAYVLDGDNMRLGLNQDLGFSHTDRTENIRRVSEVAALFADAGIIAISAFISPYSKDRQVARSIVKNNFHEIYVKATLATCESRDPKGLYKKARQGEIRQFTGVSDPYEPPDSAELVVDTEANDIAACLIQIEQYIEPHLEVKADSEHNQKKALRPNG